MDERCFYLEVLQAVTKRLKSAMEHQLCNLKSRVASGHLTILLQHTVFDILFTKKPKNPI
ncbi:hypothetical protein DHC50_02270 [Arenibacter sp. A80]|nr:hypothetical protein [Arenibacter sp. A80]RFT58008.1 hypothetical protein D0S24_02270 [Arenibacter sp. P308M17]